MNKMRKWISRFFGVIGLVFPGKHTRNVLYPKSFSAKRLGFQAVYLDNYRNRRESWLPWIWNNRNVDVGPYDDFIREYPSPQKPKDWKF